MNHALYFYMYVMYILYCYFTYIYILHDPDSCSKYRMSHVLHVYCLRCVVHTYWYNISCNIPVAVVKVGRTCDAPSNAPRAHAARAQEDTVSYGKHGVLSCNISASILIRSVAVETTPLHLSPQTYARAGTGGF